MSFAVVVSDIAPLYTKPEPLCELADEALYGMVLEVLAREGMYCRVRTHYRYEGWTPARCLLEDGALAAHVIGGGEPKGICGSGGVDAAACLLELELLDETGYLEDDPAVLCGAVSLTQKDVRMIQLAKSAVCAGMRTLAHHAGLRWDEVAELIVAGGFGSYLNLESAGKIGLIPEEMTGRTRAVGNASLDGAAMMLLDTALRSESEKMALGAETVDLSTDPVFMESYTEGMFF